MNISRRGFLRAGAGALGAGVALTLPQWSSAAEWGAVEMAGLPPRRVLEIVHYGGLSPWESYWVAAGDEPFGDADGGIANVNMRGAAGLVKDFAWCEDGPPEQVKYFGTDDAGQDIFWGPATAPLWTPEILGSARMVALQHDLDPHEAAMPLTLTGLRLGDPRMAGLGAAIAHRYNSLPGASSLPRAYVLMPSDIGAFGAISAPILATGQHPGSSRPLKLRLSSSGLGEQLAEAQPGPGEAGALERLRAQYRNRLRWQGAGDPLRSPQFSDYVAAAQTLDSATDLHTLLGGDALALQDAENCQIPAQPRLNATEHGLEVAAKLLDPSQGDARYVAVFDQGFQHYGGAPYDTHNDSGAHIPMSLTNLHNCLSHLAALIDSGAIDLSDTMVVLTTEFGRTPSLGSGDGREHFPAGFVQVFLGCPGAQGIVGSLSASGVADAPSTGGPLARLTPAPASCSPPV